MEKKLKHRIIGTIVILALIVIFLPMLFTKHEELASMEKVESIPVAPVQPVVQQPLQASSEATQTQISTPSVQESALTIEEIPITKPIPESTVKDQTDVSNQKSETIQPPVIQNTVIKKEVRVTPITHRLKISSHPLRARHRSLVHSKKAHLSITQKKRLAKAKAHSKAWVVQLGSFSQQQHAKVLVQKLRKKGFTAFGYQTKVGNTVYTRVYVGPAIRLKQAQTMQTRLNKDVKIKGIVVKFDATRLK